jgi:hypothetical protein
LAADLNTDPGVADVIEKTSETARAQFARTEETALGDVTEAMARRIVNEAVKRAEAGGREGFAQCCAPEVAPRNSSQRRARSAPRLLSSAGVVRVDV